MFIFLVFISAGLPLQAYKWLLTYQRCMSMSILIRTQEELGLSATRLLLARTRERRCVHSTYCTQTPVMWSAKYSGAVMMPSFISQILTIDFGHTQRWAMGIPHSSPWVWGMGCLLSVQNVIYFLPLLLQCWIWYHDILVRIKMAPD